MRHLFILLLLILPLTACEVTTQRGAEIIRLHDNYYLDIYTDTTFIGITPESPNQHHGHYLVLNDSQEFVEKNGVRFKKFVLGRDQPVNGNVRLYTDDSTVLLSENPPRVIFDLKLRPEEKKRAAYLTDFSGEYGNNVVFTRPPVLELAQAADWQSIAGGYKNPVYVHAVGTFEPNPKIPGKMLFIEEHTQGSIPAWNNTPSDYTDYIETQKNRCNPCTLIREQSTRGYIPWQKGDRYEIYAYLHKEKSGSLSLTVIRLKRLSDTPLPCASF